MCRFHINNILVVDAFVIELAFGKICIHSAVSELNNLHLNARCIYCTSNDGSQLIGLCCEKFGIKTILIKLLLWSLSVHSFVIWCMNFTWTQKLISSLILWKFWAKELDKIYLKTLVRYIYIYIYIFVCVCFFWVVTNFPPIVVYHRNEDILWCSDVFCCVITQMKTYLDVVIYCYRHFSCAEWPPTTVRHCQIPRQMVAFIFTSEIFRDCTSVLRNCPELKFRIHNIFVFLAVTFGTYPWPFPFPGWCGGHSEHS